MVVLYHQQPEVAKHLLNLVATQDRVNRRFRAHLSELLLQIHFVNIVQITYFRFGVSYHGAAQSASGTKEQVASYREQNRELFNSISQFGNTDA